MFNIIVLATSILAVAVTAAPPKPNAIPEMARLGERCGVEIGKECEVGTFCRMSDGPGIFTGVCQSLASIAKIGEKCGVEIEKECEEGSFCRASDEPGFTGVCQSLASIAKVDEKCGVEIGKECEAGTFCRMSEEPGFFTGTCRPLASIAKIGEDCGVEIDKECEADAFCYLSPHVVKVGFVGTCQPLHPVAGGRCGKMDHVRVQCASGFRCDRVDATSEWEGQCVPEASVAVVRAGGRCGSGKKCAPNAECRPTRAASICVPRLSHPAQTCTKYGPWPIRCAPGLECGFDEDHNGTDIKGKCIGF